MNWDDVISNESQFVLLPEGIYEFTVTKFEREWFDGSAKIEACPKAVLELTINAPQGTAVVKESLLLSAQVEWKLCSFFRSIGQKKHGQQFKMDWSKVLNAKGTAEIEINEYVGNDGSQKKNNRVKSYIDAPEGAPQEESQNEPLPWE